MYRITTFENGKRSPRFRRLRIEQAIQFFQWLLWTNPEVDPWLETDTDSEVVLPLKARQAIAGSFEEYIDGLSSEELRNLAISQHLQILEAQVPRKVEAVDSADSGMSGDMNIVHLANGLARLDLSVCLSQELLIAFLNALTQSLKAISQ